MTSVSNQQYHISSLLEKMTSADKDYRFMATNDLMSELQRDSIKLDDDSERKVCKMLLKLLEDKNAEVQNLAVKCMGPLVMKVKDAQAEIIVDTLCNNMSGNNEQLRDVSSIALKTVIQGLPPGAVQLTVNIIRRVTPKVTSTLIADRSEMADVSVKLESLDIMADILSRYGGITAQWHSQIQEVLLPELSSDRLAIRKRAMNALSHLVAVSSEVIFNSLMEHLVGDLKANARLSTTRTYVATTAAVCKASGSRFAEKVPQVIPILIKFCGETEDDELRESCLAAFEAFLPRCPKEMKEFVPEIMELCAKYICWDPNYHYDEDEDDEENENGMDADDGFEDDEGDEYSDDDDLSWKVRRASAKTLEGLIASRRDMLPVFYQNISPLLITRFKEREDNVKADIFHAYIALIRQTKLAIPLAAQQGNRSILDLLEDQNGMEEDGTPSNMTLSNEQITIANHLKNQIPILVKAVNRQLREKSLKTRHFCFALLSELLRVVPGALGNELDLLMAGVSSGIREKSVNMKIDTLSFLSSALATHCPKVFYAHIPQLVPLATAAVEDQFYKVSGEALNVIMGLTRVLRPLDQPKLQFDFTPYVDDIYSAVYNRLRATDIDQEVKEKAIATSGQLIATFGDCLNGKLSECLPILMDRLRNEMTRLTTVKTLNVIGNSPLNIDLRPILPQALPLLADFLRKNQRALKLNTLQLLETFVKRYGSDMSPEEAATGYNPVLVELPPLINESDTQIAQMTFKLITEMIKSIGGSGVIGQEILDEIVKQTVILTQSPLLQGSSCLNSLLQFIHTLSQSNIPATPSFKELLNRLTGPIEQAPTSTPQSSQSGFGLHKQAYLSIAKCVATLAAAHPAEAAPLAENLANTLTNSGVDEGVQLFSLLVIGEIGRRCPDVFTGKGIKGVKPEQIISSAFLSPSEEIKTAASYSLGGLAVGNLEKFLPFILEEIDSQPKRQYLLLHALKEVIGSESENAEDVFKPRINDIWKVLVDHANCQEEGTRNVVAECLGKLTLMQPNVLLPMLQELVTHESSAVRATVVTAVKFTIVDQPQAIDHSLKSCIKDFLDTLTDSDLNVRRVALVTFNSAAHNKASLIRHLLPKLLPNLYTETKPRKELVREVEMGPFKHTVDDGLDLRKAAFECMYTLLDKCLERLDVYEFLDHVEDGLKDHYDIKLLTYLMLARMCAICPQQVLQRMSRLLEPLKATLAFKVKANSVKQEFEKQEELKRSALRAVFSLQSVPDSEKVTHLNDILGMIKQSSELQPLYTLVERDPGIFGRQSLIHGNSEAMDIN